MTKVEIQEFEVEILNQVSYFIESTDLQRLYFELVEMVFISDIIQYGTEDDFKNLHQLFVLLRKLINQSSKYKKESC